MFWQKTLLFSPRLNLFGQKYSKNSNIVKYYYKITDNYHVLLEKKLFTDVKAEFSLFFDKKVQKNSIYLKYFCNKVMSLLPLLIKWTHYCRAILISPTQLNSSVYITLGIWIWLCKFLMVLLSENITTTSVFSHFFTIYSCAMSFSLRRNGRKNPQTSVREQIINGLFSQSSKDC